MMNCSQRCLLAITGLLCLLSQGFGASLPRTIDGNKDEVVVPINELFEKLEQEAANSTNPFSFTEKTHLVRREHDMVFTMQELIERHHQNREKRTAAIKPNRHEKRWRNNVVNYEFEEGTFSIKDMREIYRSVRDIAHYTCLTFEQTSRTLNRIRLQKGDGGCYSRVGMVGGVQELGLAKACRTKATIIHEFLHAIGIQHEQTRPDRDDHVTIHYDKIQTRNAYNFDKETWNSVNTFGIPYDYLSIMHYGGTDFAKSWGDLTIETKDPDYQQVIGTAPGLSVGDIRTLNAMHSCVPDSCPLRESECQDVGGFVGKDCKCWCPVPDFHNPVEYCFQKDIDENGSLNLACKDFEEDCPEWAASGFCDEGQYWGYMFTYCGKSCKSC